MLSKLSQIVTSVPSPGSTSNAEQQEQRSPANTRREQARLRQHSLEGSASYAVLHPSSDDDSIISAPARPRRLPLISTHSSPPNVSWLNTDPRLTHAASAPLIGRSVSSPLSQDVSTSGSSSPSQTQGKGFTHLQVKSTHSLRLDYRRTSPISTSNPFVQPQPTLSLSPIREQLSPEQRSALLPPINPTREVDVTDELGARSSPAASYHSSSFFLTRPLKRSISQGSTNTFTSTASLAPPPLTPTGLSRAPYTPLTPNPYSPPGPYPTTSPYSPIAPHTGPYTTARPGPLPTIAASVRRTSSGDGETSSLRTASFVTAPTVYTYAHSRSSASASSLPEEEEDITHREGGQTSPLRDSVVSSEMHDHQLYHVSLDLEPQPSESPGARSFVSELLRPPTVSTPSFDATSDHHQRASSFIDKRWLKDESFCSDHIEVHKRTQHRAPRALFWLGFVLGPWCWLIGGWLILDSYAPPRRRRRRQHDAEKAEENTGTGKLEQSPAGQKRHLPLWLGKAKPRDTGKAKARASPSPSSNPNPNPKTGQHSAWEALRIYPVFAPSTEHLGVEKGNGNAAARLLYLIRKGHTAGDADADAWVRRCRAAAVVSGVLLVVAFLAALAVAGGYRH